MACEISVKFIKCKKFNLIIIEVLPRKSEGLTLTGMDTMMVGWWVRVGEANLVQMH